MTIEERLDSLEKAFTELRRELRDAATVDAYKVSRLETRAEDAREWLATHTKAISEHDERMARLDERMARFEETREKAHKEAVERGHDLDKRIADLVSGIGACHAAGAWGKD